MRERERGEHHRGRDSPSAVTHHRRSQTIGGGNESRAGRPWSTRPAHLGGSETASPVLFVKLSEAQAERAKLLLDLVQARLTEILAAQQLVLGPHGQFADRDDIQTLKGLPAADAELEIGDRLDEQFRRDVPGRRRRAAGRRNL